jgi:hypothetical protein
VVVVDVDEENHLRDLETYIDDSVGANCRFLMPYSYSFKAIESDIFKEIANKHDMVYAPFDTSYWLEESLDTVKSRTDLILITAGYMIGLEE